VEPSSREKILEVAEARFAQRGFAGVGMREVALAAGLGKSSLFHHFATKDELQVAVIERVIARIEAHVLPALGRGGDPAATLGRAVDALIDALAEHPATARLLLRSLVEDDAFAAADPPGLAAVEARIQALVDRFTALLGAPDRVQTLIGATVYHFASGEFGEAVLGGPLFSAEAVARRKREVKALFVHGLASPPCAPKERPPS
jgi:AcrR family transcriptional regulator